VNIYSNPYQWKRIRKRVLVLGESKRSTARKEGISRKTLRKILVHESPPGYRGRKQPAYDNTLSHSLPQKPPSKSVKTKKQWMEWLYLLEQNPDKVFDERINVSELRTLFFALTDRYRQRSLVILAKKSGFSLHAISAHLGIDRKTARAYVKRFSQGGPELLFGRNRKVPRKADNEAFKKALFALLHEPPSLSGFNRTTWRMADLRSTLRKRGHPACASVIREAIKKAGYRWRSAKVVLTSNDPDYREKLERVHSVLGNLRETECFFSIDEFGPFADQSETRSCSRRTRSYPQYTPMAKIQRLAHCHCRPGTVNESGYSFLLSEKEHKRNDQNGAITN
jgi:transposase